MGWDKHLLSGFDDGQGAKMIRIAILDWIGFEKVEHERRCNTLLDED